MIPMYVYLYPIITAILAGSIAIYAAHKAYDGALLADQREKFFKTDEIERKRLAYILVLQRALKQIRMDFNEYMLAEIENSINENLEKRNFKSIKNDAKNNFYLSAEYESLYADWNILSCLQADVLKDLFAVRSSLEDNKWRVEFLEVACANLSAMQDSGKSYPDSKVEELREDSKNLMKQMASVRRQGAKLDSRLKKLYKI